MKKILFTGMLSLLLFGSGLFILSARGSSSEAGGKVILEFPTWQAEEGGFAEFWKKMVAKFEKREPNVEINLYQISFGQFHDTLTTRYSAGDPPDITHIASRFLAQFTAQKWFEPLDSRFAGTDILNNWTPLQSSMEIGGKQMGLLIMGYGYVFYYNEKILNDAGVKVPTNRSELLEAAKKIDSMGYNDIKAYGLTTQQHPNVYQEFSSFATGEGAELIVNGQYNLSSAPVIQAADDYRTMASYAPKGLTTAMVRQNFIDGKIAMMMDGPWVMALLDKASDDIRPYLKSTRPPFARVPGSISNSLHMAAGLPEEKKQLVWEFIQMVAEPENQLQYTLLTRSPTPRAGMADSLDSPELTLVNNLASEAVNVLPDSENLMIQYSKYTNTWVDSLLQLQTSDESTTRVFQELETKLDKAGLKP